MIRITLILFSMFFLAFMTLGQARPDRSCNAFGFMSSDDCDECIVEDIDIYISQGKYMSAINLADNVLPKSYWDYNCVRADAYASLCFGTSLIPLVNALSAGSFSILTLNRVLVSNTQAQVFTSTEYLTVAKACTGIVNNQNSMNRALLGLMTMSRAAVEMGVDDDGRITSYNATSASNSVEGLGVACSNATAATGIPGMAASCVTQCTAVYCNSNCDIGSSTAECAQKRMAAYMMGTTCAAVPLFCPVACVCPARNDNIYHIENNKTDNEDSI